MISLMITKNTLKILTLKNHIQKQMGYVIPKRVIFEEEVSIISNN